MVYTVQYRSPQGAETVCVEAENRAAVFGELKKRGLNGAVISVKEGKVRKISTAPGNRRQGGRRTGGIRALVAGLIIVIGGGIAAWLLMPTDKTIIKEEDAKVSVKKSLDWNVTTNKSEEGSAKEDPVESPKEPKEGVIPPGYIKLPTGMLLRYKLPEEGKTRKLISNGEIYEIDHAGNVKNISPKPLFTKPFERTLSFLAYPDDGILLMDEVAEMKQKDIIKWCNEPTEYYDDDTDEDLAKRKTVAEMKAMVLEYLEGGGTFLEYAKEVRAFNDKERDFHAAGLHEIATAIKEGRVQDARNYVKAVNIMAKEKGYQDLMIPTRFKAMLEDGEQDQ